MKIKMIYNNASKQDRIMSNGHQLLNDFGQLRAKIGPGTLRPRTPIDTPICNVCRHSSEVKNCNQSQLLQQSPRLSNNSRNDFVTKKIIATK
jgi:hypothetical protein